MKRVMFNQGSGAKIMYPDLYQGLGLKDEGLSKYDTLLVGFDGKVVTFARYIKILVVAKGKEVWVNFIVVHT